MSYNLPPGVRECDLPGNRPEDVGWEQFHQRVDDDTVERGMSPEEATIVWQAALRVYDYYRAALDGETQEEEGAAQ